MTQKNFITEGKVASQGSLEGKVRLLSNEGEDDPVFFEDKILVVEYTSPEHYPYIINSRGVITEMGGLLSHAAIITRELNKPSIVGAVGIREYLRDNDYITVEEHGRIYKVS